MKTRLSLLLLAFIMLSISPSEAQRKGKKQENDSAETKPTVPEDKYEAFLKDKEVVTSGMFKVFKKDRSYFFEIPDSLMNREMLLATKISGFVENLAFGGAGMGPKDEYVVSWEKLDNRLYLKAISFSNVANDDEPVAQSIKYNNYSPIIKSFEIKATPKTNDSHVIEVTDLFTTDVDMIGPLTSAQRTSFKIRSLDRDRSGIKYVKGFPENLEVRHFLTYNGDNLPDNRSTNSLTVELNQSFVLLPKVPMMPRLGDERVGFYGVSVRDYSEKEVRAQRKMYVARWRLEPKDWDAYWRGELVEPVKPIVYYIDPATPVKWRKYIKAGIEDWQSAFEKIGFKNAILAKDPPSPQEDPNWSPEDIRYSVVRYITTQIVNAQGPHVRDPRSGEILESDILWYSNVITWLRTLTMIQTGAINPKGRKPALSDEDMGTMIRYVMAHEVGHTLGMQHNFAASAAYPVDSLRSPSFTKKWGITSSIMEYARANYVAQPGDGDVHLFNDKIGPYDEFAIQFAYKPIKGIKTPEDELPIINKWMVEKAGNPYYRYGAQTNPANHIDPTAQNEDLGDDNLKANAYGMANLKRIVPNLVKWNFQEGSDYTALEEAYDQAIGQWSNYIRHAVQHVGGVKYIPKRNGQDGLVYERVSVAQQKRAVGFLMEHAYQTPEWLLDQSILMRLAHGGFVTRIQNVQSGNLNMLLNDSRLARLIEAESVNPREAYGLNSFMTDLRKGLWSELNRASAIDVYRRNLQKSYLERLNYLLVNEQQPLPGSFPGYFAGYTPVRVSQSDIRSVVRHQLITLKSEINQAINRTTDTNSRLHLQDCISRIDDMLTKNDKK